jgi:hypothetical protein
MKKTGTQAFLGLTEKELMKPDLDPEEDLFAPMKSGIFNFNYDNLMSTGGAGEAHVSGASDILAPFNSTLGS